MAANEFEGFPTLEPGTPLGRMWHRAIKAYLDKHDELRWCQPGEAEQGKWFNQPLVKTTRKRTPLVDLDDSSDEDIDVEEYSVGDGWVEFTEDPSLDEAPRPGEHHVFYYYALGQKMMYHPLVDYEYKLLKKQYREDGLVQVVQDIVNEWEEYWSIPAERDSLLQSLVEELIKHRVLGSRVGGCLDKEPFERLWTDLLSVEEAEGTDLESLIKDGIVGDLAHSVGRELRQIYDECHAEYNKLNSTRGGDAQVAPPGSGSGKDSKMQKLLGIMKTRGYVQLEAVEAFMQIWQRMIEQHKDPKEHDMDPVDYILAPENEEEGFSLVRLYIICCLRAGVDDDQILASDNCKAFMKADQKVKVDHLRYKLKTEILQRLSKMQHLLPKGAQLESANLVEFLARIRLANKSQTRLVKFMKSCGGSGWGEKVYRTWGFRTAGGRVDEAMEMQEVTSSERARKDLVVNAGAYTSEIEKIASCFPQQEKLFAQYMLDMVQGEELPSELTYQQRLLLVNFVYLVFGCETARNLSSLPISLLIIYRIAMPGGTLTFHDAFGRKATPKKGIKKQEGYSPMSIPSVKKKGAASAAAEVSAAEGSSENESEEDNKINRAVESARRFHERYGPYLPYKYYKYEGPCASDFPRDFLDKYVRLPEALSGQPLAQGSAAAAANSGPKQEDGSGGGGGSPTAPRSP